MTSEILLPLSKRPLEGGQPPDRSASPGGGPVWVNCRDPAVIGTSQLHPSKPTTHQLDRSSLLCHFRTSRRSDKQHQYLLLRRLQVRPVLLRASALPAYDNCRSS